MILRPVRSLWRRRSNLATAYGADLSWPAVAGATDYDYAVVRPDGRIVAEGKTWEPRVHLGGLAGKTVGGHGYYNVRIRANYCNYDASKNETAPVPSSEWAPSVQLALAASSAEVYFEDDFSWISPDSGSALLKTNTDWINTYCTTDTMVRLDILLNEGSVTLNGWGYDATNKSVYTRPGYIHINSSKALGTLISPAFSAIDDTRDVVVSFDATYFYQYFSKTAETGRDAKRQRPDRGCDRRRADPDARPRKCVGGFLVPHCGCRCYHAVALYARFGREEPRAVR